MANLPRKPQRGDKALQSIYNSVCQIIDYLPSLNVVGDNKTTSVNHSMYGTTVHALPQIASLGEGRTYSAGSGLSLSGTQFDVNVDNTTIKIINNTLSCTVAGGGAGDHYYNYDNVDGSIRFYSNRISEYPQNYINYIGVNPDWIAGLGQCPEGFYAIESAILNAFSGDNTYDPPKIGSVSVSAMGSQIWVNPDWLAGNDSAGGICSEGFHAVISAVWRYLNSLEHDATSCVLKINPVTSAVYWGEDLGANQNFLISTGLTSATVTDPDTGTAIGTSVALNSTYKSYLDSIGNKTSNTILSCQNGNLVWATNTAGGGGYDGNDWYKYKAMNDSLIFYPSDSNHNGTTEVSFNPNWLAGNGTGCCCYEGPAAVASAIIKILTNQLFDGAAEMIISALTTNSHWPH